MAFLLSSDSGAADWRVRSRSKGEDPRRRGTRLEKLRPLTPRAAKVLLVMEAMCWFRGPSARLALECGMSVASLRSALTELHEAGFIVRGLWRAAGGQIFGIEVQVTP